MDRQVLWAHRPKGRLQQQRDHEARAASWPHPRPQQPGGKPVRRLASATSGSGVADSSQNSSGSGRGWRSLGCRLPCGSPHPPSLPGRSAVPAVLEGVGNRFTAISAVPHGSLPTTYKARLLTFLLHLNTIHQLLFLNNQPRHVRLQIALAIAGDLIAGNRQALQSGKSLTAARPASVTCVSERSSDSRYRKPRSRARS